VSPAPKSKPLRRNAARLTRDATRSEDDAEQALKEIVASQAKPVDRHHYSPRDLRKKQTKNRS